jgi:putative addiction module component (TIGR02574 family)
MTKAQIISEVKAMPPQERTELLEDLRQFAIDDELTPEQIAEVRRRAQAVDRGEMGTVPGEKVMRELFERLGIAPR